MIVLLKHFESCIEFAKLIDNSFDNYLSPSSSTNNFVFIVVQYNLISGPN